MSHSRRESSCSGSLHQDGLSLSLCLKRTSSLFSPHMLICFSHTPPLPQLNHMTLWTQWVTTSSLIFMQSGTRVRRSLNYKYTGRVFLPGFLRLMLSEKTHSHVLALHPVIYEVVFTAPIVSIFFIPSFCLAYLCSSCPIWKVIAHCRCSLFPSHLSLFTVAKRSNTTNNWSVFSLW